MDVEFEIAGRLVVWDENKAEINRRKHGVTFETAVEVFLDRNRIEDFDELHSDYEERYRILGKVENVLVVICTDRQEKTRLISARRANKFEEEQYYGQYSDLPWNEN